MAKKAWINRNERKRAAVKKHAALRAELKAKKDYVGLSQLPFDLRDLPLSCTVADVRYRLPVDLVAAATARGHRAHDGSEMLLQQAMLSFETWTGVTPPAAVMRAALQDALAR